MTKRLYESAETFVYDPVVANRNSTRASLHSLGFRRVDLAGDIKAVELRLSERAPDLLIAEVAGSEAEVCDLIQRIRQGVCGTNPFIVVIATTWRRDGGIIQQVVNSGADDLVARPFSTAVLGDRIRAQVERRKGFVVTSAYIGPDRRHGARSGNVDSVQVPNPLKLKTLEGVDPGDLDRLIGQEVSRGRSLLNAEKLRRDAAQLCGHWRLLEQRSASAGDFLDIMARMQKLAAEIGLRATANRQAPALELCEAVSTSIVAITTLVDKAEAENRELGAEVTAPLRRLGHAALTLGQMLAPDEAEVRESVPAVAPADFRAA